MSAWHVGAGKHEVVMWFAPEGTYRRARILSGVALAACVLLAVTPRRRRRRA